MESTRRRKVANAVETVLDKPKEEGYLPPGTEITVTWGEETFSPVQYNSFRIGGHSITVLVNQNETALDAWKRGWALLERAAEIQFEDKLRGFKERIDRTKRG